MKRPGGWVPGIGWVANEMHLPAGTLCGNGGLDWVVDNGDRDDVVVIVTRWADGTVPEVERVAAQGPTCDARSGYHDDGDAMLCTLPAGHGDRHAHHSDFTWLPDFDDAKWEMLRGLVIEERDAAQAADPTIENRSWAYAFQTVLDGMDRITSYLDGES